MKRTLHHFGLPTAEKQPNDIHLESLDVYVTDVAANPNKVEWVRFGSACKLPPILSKTAHIAYKVASLEKAIKDKNVIHQPCEPMPGLRIAFILEDGVPVELLEFKQ